MPLLNLFLAFAKAVQRSFQILLRVAINPAGSPSSKSHDCNCIWGAQIPYCKILCRLCAALCFHMWIPSWGFGWNPWFGSLGWTFVGKHWSCLGTSGCSKPWGQELVRAVGVFAVSSASVPPAAPWCLFAWCALCGRLWVRPSGHQQVTEGLDAIMALKQQGALKNLGKVHAALS